MRTTILRWLLGVSIFDLLLGVVALVYASAVGAPTSTWRGAGVCLIVGAAGCWWFTNALRRSAMESRG